jgi:hypothetical protein
MTEPVENPSPGGRDNPNGSLRQAIQEQMQSAESTLSGTGGDLSEKGREIAGEANEAVVRKAESVKQGMSGSLMTLGGALRAAGNHLSENGQAGPSKFVGEAASGLERLAGSLENKPLGEVVDQLRAFGRDNAGGLFAGSMLAGLALGRLLKGADGTSQSPLSSGSGGPLSREPDESAEQTSTDASTAPPPTATSGYAL